MLRLFQAGVIAACLQCVAIGLLTPLVILYAQHRIDHQGLLDPAALPVIPILRSIDLLLAAGLALTRHRIVDLTAAHIRAASRRMNRFEPDHAVNGLLVCLLFAAGGFAALTLGPPPSLLAGFGWHFGAFDAAPIAWSATMSVGAASFGANAQAAAQAARSR